MSIFQLIACFFAAFMVYVIGIHRRKKHLSDQEAVFWYILWCSFIFLALFPNLLLGITQALKFARVFDLLTVLAFMVLSIVVFIVYFAQKENQRKLETFVRRDAIEHVRSTATPTRKREGRRVSPAKKK